MSSISAYRQSLDLPAAKTDRRPVVSRRRTIHPSVDPYTSKVNRTTASVADRIKGLASLLGSASAKAMEMPPCTPTHVSNGTLRADQRLLHGKSSRGALGLQAE